MSRSVAGLSVVCLVLAGGLLACSDSTEPAAGPSPDREPVTVSHVYGSTTIEGVPERIVAIDLQWTDTLLAMDVDPVGYTVDPYMSDVPWQDLPAGAVALPLDNGLPIEEIAALEPDLILGSYSIADQQSYDLLAAIAPTVANLDETQVTPWQDLVGIAGQVLDREDDAAALVAAVDGQVQDTATELPGLTGKTFVLAQYVVGDSIYAVADEADGSSVFSQQLGMELLPVVREEGQRQGVARVSISTERSDQLRADLVAFLINGGDEADLADIPGFDQLPGTVAILDHATIVGLNTPTPLSLPYSLEALTPHLQLAAA